MHGSRPSSDRCSPPTNRTAVSDAEFLASGSTIWCFFEEDAFDADGELTQPEGAEHQQDRPRPARPRRRVRTVLLRPAPRRDRRRHRHGRCPCPAVDVHLQAAPHRRRGRLPPGRHVPLHRPDHGDRVLVRDRGRHPRERLPVGRARRPPRPGPSALQAQRVRRRHRDGTARRHAAARHRRPAATNWSRSRCRPARSWC